MSSACEPSRSSLRSALDALGAESGMSALQRLGVPDSGMRASRRRTGRVAGLVIEQPPPAHLIPSHETLMQAEEERKQRYQHQSPRLATATIASPVPLSFALPPAPFPASASSSPDRSATNSPIPTISAMNLADEEAVPSSDTGDELRALRSAAVRIQSLYRGASLRRILADPSVDMPEVNPSRRECWRINQARRRAIEAERPVAQLLDPACVRVILGFLPFREVARNLTVTCREWLAAARMPNSRQATMTLVTHASLTRMSHSSLLGHFGALHTSLRVCVSPLALNFDLFQSYFDMAPRELCELATRFPALSELVTCIKSDSVGSMVPQSPQGIHGHIYGGRTGHLNQTRRRLTLSVAAPTLGRVGSDDTVSGGGASTPKEEEEFHIVFPTSLKTAVLELGLPVPAATATVIALSNLAHLENLTLLAISEIDLTPLLSVRTLRSLSVRYSNLSGKTTRLRFPRAHQYAVLRQMRQLRELEVEEGFLVEPAHPHAQSVGGGVGSFLHELLLDETHARAEPPQPTPQQLAAGAQPSLPPPIVHDFRLHHLHMEKTTLVRGNEPALLTLPTLTTLTPFRFSYDNNFAFLRALPCLTQLHLHFSTSTSPPPPMLPLMSHLLTCRGLTELSFRGVAFGASEQLLLLTYLAQVRLLKFRLMFCTLPSLRCVQTLAPTLRSLTLDSCVCLGVDPHNPGARAPHVLFPYNDLVVFLQKMPCLTELYLNGTFEQLPYTTLQLLTYPSQFFPALKKLVLTQGSVMLSSYDHRPSRLPEEVALELEPEAQPGADDDDDDEDAPRPVLPNRRNTRRHSARPGFNPPGLRR